jgi:hypothetical protein
MVGIWRRMTSTLSKVSGAQLAEFIRFFKYSAAYELSR